MPQDSSPSSTCPPGPPAGTNGSSDIMVNFDPDPADLALSSVPGQEAFDPRRHRFSEEELKPQPMIKKARKMLVPNEQKVLQLETLSQMLSPSLLLLLLASLANATSWSSEEVWPTLSELQKCLELLHI